MKLLKGKEEAALTEAQYRARLTAHMEKQVAQTGLLIRHLVAVGTVTGLLLQVACEKHGYAPEVVDGVVTGRLIKAETLWAKCKRKISRKQGV